MKKIIRRHAKKFIFVGVGLLCAYQLFFSTSTPHAVKGADYRNLFLDESFATDVQNLEDHLKLLTRTGNRECVLPKKFGKLLSEMAGDVHWRWIAERVEHNWDYVSEAREQLMREGKLANRTCLYILVLPGLLTQTNFAQKAFEGGPLGELVQWADLITALHVLGHRVSLRYDLAYTGLDLRTLMMESFATSTDGCIDGPFDVIFTDLSGHASLPSDVKEKYRSRLRIIDSYGTEVQYNYLHQAQKLGIVRSAGTRGLYIKHFYTMYPETVDNSFLGFMVHPTQSNINKENTAILYGKDPLYAQRKRDFINSLRPFVELHSTLPSHPVFEALPGVVNHGVLRSEEYRSVTEKSKYFIGLGDPIEGPGMIEALSRGSIILQPQLEPPLNLGSIGKPSNRTLYSQVPYLDRFGPPNVFTFKYSNPFKLTEIFKITADIKVKPKLPYEFTAQAFLERLEMTLTEYDLCTKKPWRRKHMKDNKVKAILSSQADLSCTQVCNEKGLLCDVTAFESINHLSFLHQLTNCTGSSTEQEVYAPAIQGSQCVLQGDVRLYSCASYTGQNIYRVCPCVQCDSTNQHFCGLR